jgi:hypothetical protein
MRFLAIYKAAEHRAPPSTDELLAMGRLITQMRREGVLLGTEGLLSSARGARVRRSGNRISVVDGPFGDASEVIGGVALLRASSKEEAIELTKRLLAVTGDGESEIRQVFDAPPAGL